MHDKNYLQWLVNETPTHWWHDSGDPDELRRAIEHGATGVTTNPVLTYATLKATPEKWKTVLHGMPRDVSQTERAEYLMHAVAMRAAGVLEPVFKATNGPEGYVCAQVPPWRAGERDIMFEAAKRFHGWASNIAVKLPVTAAGLDVLEDCAALGMTVTATVSFTVPQVIAIAERFRRGIERAEQAGLKPGRCFAVIMIGRLDDYLRDVVMDRKADATVCESDIRHAGLAVTKRAYSIFKERSYEAVLLVAALRGVHHMVELTGAELIMSIHPKYQDLLLEPGVPRGPAGIDVPVDAGSIHRLRTIPEFVRAYEPDGMQPEDFITYGATQRTLAQFHFVGWAGLENLEA